jgi:hypothetical protein
MSELAHNIEDRVLAYMREDVACERLPNDQRLGCLTPLEYPDGDNVTVWIDPSNSLLEVTDYGEAMSEPPTGKARRAVDEIADALAARHGVEYIAGRLIVRCEIDSVGETVWRLAAAAAQLAQAVKSLQQRRQVVTMAKHSFVDEVAHTFMERKVDVVREHEIEGRSGHRHRATIYIPKAEAVFEPLRAQWNQAATAYVKFGDLQAVNGFHLYSLLDDRDQETEEEHIANLLTQVSSVLQWSRRQEWIESVTDLGA